MFKLTHCLALLDKLLTATIFGLNNVTDAKIDGRDPLKQTNGINPIALGQLTQREAMIPLLGCGLLALGLAAWLSILPWAFLVLTLGVLYSLPPVRLKERAGLALLAHSLVPLSILLMGMAAAQANHPLRAAVGAAILVLEILAIFRAGYYLPKQRLLFSLSYTAGGVVFVLLIG